MYFGGYPGDNANGYGVWFGNNGFVEPLWTDDDGRLIPFKPQYGIISELFNGTDAYVVVSKIC